MTTVQQDFVDYKQGGDSGDDTVDAVQPVSDGEGASQTVFRRPTENVRGRTEVARDVLHDSLYYNSRAQYCIEQATGASLAWGGSITHAGTGIITQTGALTFRPFLTPAASTHASLTVGTHAVNAVKYAVAIGSYAYDGMNAVTVAHVDTGAASPLVVTVSPGPVYRVLVQFDSTNVAHNSTATAAAAAAAIAGSAFLNTRLLAIDDGVAGTTIAALAETRLEGTQDQEAHVLPSNLLTTYTTLHPLSDGDCVAVWYRYVVDPPGGFAGDPKVGVPGGRAQSVVEAGSSTIPIASLFTTSTGPSKLPGAVAICKVVNGELVFIDGTRYASGASGPIGTVSASAVHVDDSSFHGDPTLIVNGGITTPLTPPTAQQAFNDIDVRLGNLRAVTWVVTDSVNSTGGNFNNAAGLASAITALAGAGGIIHVRRGAYTLPPVFTIPNNTTIIGEGLGQVTLTQPATTSFTVGLNCRLENLIISVQIDNAVVVTGGSTLDNVRISQGNISFSGSNTHTNNLTVTAKARDGFQVAFTGTGCSAKNVSTTGPISLSGTACSLENFVIVPDQDIDFTGTAFLAVTGNACAVRQGSVGNPARDFVSSTTQSMLLLSGAENRIEGTIVNTTTSALTATRVGLKIQDAIACSVTDTTVAMTRGVPYAIAGGAGNLISSVSLERCFFSNNSNNASDNVMTVPTALALSLDMTVKNCYFTQTEQTAHPLADLTFAAALPALATRLVFDNCYFEAANLASFAFKATRGHFKDCTFGIKNPIVAGSRRLGGHADGQLSPIFIFDSDAAGNGNVLVDNCIIDGWDAEVNNSAGVPTYDVSLFVSLANRAIANNLRLKNINRHISSTNDSAGLITLTNSSRLRGCQIEFTTTAAVQAGASRLVNIFSMGPKTEVADMSQDMSGFPPVTLMSIFKFPGGSQADVRLRNVQFFGATFNTPFDYVTTSTLADRFTIENCVFGNSTHGAAAGVVMPAGQWQRWYNCEFWTETNNTQLFLAASADNVNYSHFDGCRFFSTVTLDAGGELVSQTDGDAGTLTGLRFTGNLFKYTATGAGAKAFNTTTFVQTVWAGNVWVTTGGTATTPSFGAVVNVP